MRIAQPPTADSRLYPNVLLYGSPKTGKTAGACSGPGQVTLVNCDLPNASYFAHERDPEGRITELALDQGDVMNTMIELVTQLRAGDSELPRTIVVDPVGELHRRLIEEASNRAVRPTLPQYGDTSTHIERFCRALCELEVMTVLVCHDYPVRDEASGQIERLPWTGTTNPALGSKLMGMVDIVGYTGVIERDTGRVYAAQLVTAGGRRGGDRFNRLGEWAPLDLTRWHYVLTHDENHSTQEVAA
jgi:hypothetical protein